MSSVERHTRPLGLNVWPACIGFHRAMCGMQGEILRWQKKNSCVYCGSPHFFHGMHCDHSTIALYYDVFWRALFLSSIRYLAL